MPDLYWSPHAIAAFSNARPTSNEIDDVVLCSRAIQSTPLNCGDPIPFLWEVFGSTSVKPRVVTCGRFRLVFTVEGEILDCYVDETTL